MGYQETLIALRSASVIPYTYNRGHGLISEAEYGVIPSLFIYLFLFSHFLLFSVSVFFLPSSILAFIYMYVCMYPCFYM